MLETSSRSGRCARLLDVVEAKASVSGVDGSRHGALHGVGVDVDGERLRVACERNRQITCLRYTGEQKVNGSRLVKIWYNRIKFICAP